MAIETREVGDDAGLDAAMQELLNAAHKYREYVKRHNRDRLAGVLFVRVGHELVIYSESEKYANQIFALGFDASRDSFVDVDGQLPDKAGPLNCERMTLDELLVELNKWKEIAGGRTCVSFTCLCIGAASLWHQTHRQNFRAIDRAPEALSRWVLAHEGGVRMDFPEQVLELLVRMDDELKTKDAQYRTLLARMQDERRPG